MAVAELPRGQRAAVLLHYVAGLSQAEAAATLGVRVGAVKVRLHEARRALRAPLRDLWTEEKRMAPEPKEAQSVEVVVESVRVNFATGQRAIVLAERGGERLLPISVGPADGDALVVPLQKIAVPRPGTHDLALSLLGASQARVTAVTVERLTEDVFYSTVAVDSPAGQSAVDARPSDAINLAVRAGAPIYVSPTVLATAGGTRAELEAREAGSRESQLAAIRALGEAAASVGARTWLLGGWAADFRTGRISRRPTGVGVEVGALDRDRERLRPTLAAAGFERVGEGADSLDLRKADVPLRVQFVARTGGRLMRRRLEGVEALIRPDRPDLTAWLPAGMGVELTPAAARVLARARDEEASRLGHGYVGTEHLLLALTRSGKDSAVVAITEAGAKPGQVREAVERVVGRGGAMPRSEPRPTPRALGAVRLAAEHASSAGRPVDTRDLLIGLIDEGEGVAAGALGAAGLDLAGLRERLVGTG
jgi:hypothetical protein